jgi:hypothetical protein
MDGAGCGNHLVLGETVAIKGTITVITDLLSHLAVFNAPLVCKVSSLFGLQPESREVSISETQA